jgi:ABC-type Fe3+-hydroxamate transport system substrate-binding protein
MLSFTDQTYRQITLAQLPTRIISLVPSQTELLFDLGLREEVVGITKFCVHPPEWFRSKTRVGGTKQLKMDIIHQLQPDLIIANKEENVKEQVEELASHYPVWISDVNNLEDACDMIRSIGKMTGKDQNAEGIVKDIIKSFSQLPPPTQMLRRPMDSRLHTVYLIWREPYMTIGNDTFIHSMMKAAGFENVYSDQTRYPEITIEELKTKNPALLLLSSEPFPFKQKHADELQLHLPQTRILLVDGEMFSWYGSRLMQAASYFARLLLEIKVNR